MMDSCRSEIFELGEYLQMIETSSVDPGWTLKHSRKLMVSIEGSCAIDLKSEIGLIDTAIKFDEDNKADEMIGAFYKVRKGIKKKLKE